MSENENAYIKLFALNMGRNNKVDILLAKYIQHTV